jgi:hypothetical protein
MKRNFFQAILGAGLLSGCVSQPQFSETTTTEEREQVVAQEEMKPTPYRLPLISIGAKFSGLPPAVQNTIRAEVGTLTMTDIVKDTGSGKTVYQIYFANAELFPPLYIAPDGSVLNPDLTVAVAAPEEHIGVSTAGAGLQPSDLPPEVLRTIQSKAPSGEIARIFKETWGNQAVYIVSFKDPAHNPKLYVASDGTMVGGTHGP